MTGSDDEFEDFLKRRKPVFRSPDDMFEPPEELDRIVLRQAREAIQTERPLRVFRGPRWAAPMALAATLVLAFAVMFQGGMTQKNEPVPEVTVQNIAERVEVPEAAAPAAPAPSVVANNPPREAFADSDAVVVDLAANAERSAAAEQSAAPPSSAASRVAGAASGPVVTAASAPAADAPAWRKDSKAWLAEIKRLQDAGETAAAEAELAEYNRQQRAYAGAPDR